MTFAAQSITGDSETRPKTIAVNYIIKLYHDVADGSVSIAEATATAAGIVSTSAQSMAGVKTFNDGIKTDTINTNNGKLSQFAMLNAAKSPLLALSLGLTPRAVGNMVSVNTGPRDVAFDGTSIWVCNYDSDNVSKINPSTNDVVATVSVNTNPIGVAFDGTSIWVSNNGSNNVSKINPSTNAVVATVSVNTNPIGVAFDGTSIWVSNSDSNNVSIIPFF